MLDEDLARLYGVETKRLNEAVKRNLGRFPSDFMFELTMDEVAGLRSQSATSKGRGGRRYAPLVFTEHGVAMLSSVLNSERAIAVNIEIMRAFVALRRALSRHDEMAQRLAVVEARLDQHRAEVATTATKTDATLAEHDRHIRIVFETIRRLMTEDEPKPPACVGFDLE